MVVEYIDVTERKYKPMWYHTRNLMQTATGYGKKLNSGYMVKTTDGKWYRSYICIFSNSGTEYIIKRGKSLVVHEI